MLLSRAEHTALGALAADAELSIEDYFGALIRNKVHRLGALILPDAKHEDGRPVVSGSPTLSELKESPLWRTVVPEKQWERTKIRGAFLGGRGTAAGLPWPNGRQKKLTKPGKVLALRRPKTTRTKK